MSEELRHCPFCGSYHVRVCTIPTGYKLNPRVWYVKCDDCESRGSQVFDKTEAITRWNIRVERTCLMEWHEQTERTCERVLYKPTGVLVCSECGAGMPMQLDKYCYLNYCPNCGAKVVGE